jgi:hypothetical protein
MNGFYVFSVVFFLLKEDGLSSPLTKSLNSVDPSEIELFVKEKKEILLYNERVCFHLSSNIILLE